MSKPVATVTLTPAFVATYNELWGDTPATAVVYAVTGGFAFELTGCYANTGLLGDANGAAFATVDAALALALDPASEAGEFEGEFSHLGD